MHVFLHLSVDILQPSMVSLYKNSPRGNEKERLKMKKIVAIVLAALMLVSMTACGNAEKKDSENK